MRPRRKRLLFIAPLALIGMALFIFLGGEIVKLLWNWLLPPLFGFHQIDFWRAIGILILCRILFGGFRIGSRGPGMRARMRERWGHMTPEERERFRQKMCERWGFEPYSHGPTTTGPTGENTPL